MTDATFIGPRHAEFLREQYPGMHAAKRIARDLGCSDELAKKMLQGLPPSRRIFDRMVMKYGPLYLGWIYEPVGEWAKKMLAKERVAKLEAELKAAKAELYGEGEAA